MNINSTAEPSFAGFLLAGIVTVIVLIMILIITNNYMHDGFVSFGELNLLLLQTDFYCQGDQLGVIFYVLCRFGCTVGIR